VSLTRWFDRAGQRPEADIGPLSRVCRNLQRALDLATIVADAKYDLFREFVTPRGNALPEYLNQVRNATLAALNVTRNPFAAV